MAVQGDLTKLKPYIALSKEITRDEFLKAIDIINEYKRQLNAECRDVNKLIQDIPELGHINKPSSNLYYDTNISTSLRNKLRMVISTLPALKDIEGIKVSDIQAISVKRLRKVKGFGPKLIEEFYELILSAGLKITP